MPLQRLVELETRLQVVESHGTAPANTLRQKTATERSATIDAVGSSQAVTVIDTENDVTEVDRTAIAYYVTSQGDMEYQGRAGERTFMQAFRDRLDSWPDDDFLRMKNASNAGTPDFLSSASHEYTETVLPPKELTMQLVDAALNAHRYLSFVHVPSVYTSLDLLYDLGEANYGVAEERFLPLLFAILAYGSLYAELEDVGSDWESTVSRG